MSEWISVKDRLPARGQEVLWWEVGTPYDETHRYYSMGIYNPDVWQPRLTFATHWMPLPEPPEGKRKSRPEGRQIQEEVRRKKL